MVRPQGSAADPRADRAQCAPRSAREKRHFEAKKLPAGIGERISQIVDKGILESSLIKDKKARYDGYKAGKTRMAETLSAELGAEVFAANEKLIKEEFEERKYNVVREYVMAERKRIDGRDMKTIRPIMTEVGILPRVHGSALFQRGETQALVTATLGTSTDEQKIDSLVGERWKRFLLHYNFPPFSTRRDQADARPPVVASRSRRLSPSARSCA